MWVDHSLCLTGGGPWQGNALFWLSLILKAWHSQSYCSFDYNFSHLNVCWKLSYPWTAFRWSVMDYLINVLSLIHISQYASSDIILCYERTKARTCLLIREKKWIKASFSSFSATWWLAKTLFWINMSYNTHCAEWNWNHCHGCSFQPLTFKTYLTKDLCLCRRNDFEECCENNQDKISLIVLRREIVFQYWKQFLPQGKKNVYVISDQRAFEVCVLAVRVSRRLWINKAHL